MKNREDSEIFRILIAGDFCPFAGGGKDSQFLGELARAFEQADLVIANLECPLTESGNRIKKSGPHLKSSPESAIMLKRAEIDLVTLANNHLMDYGEEGFKDTLSTLEKLGIGWVGAGANSSEASRVKYVDIDNTRLGILNFTATEFSTAGQRTAGANRLGAVEAFYQIREARLNSDFQLVIIHGGIEHYSYPTPAQQKLYRFIADLGVSAVVGHHSHCPGGYELWGGVPIFYSLGNFIFREADNSPAWYEGLLLELSFSGKNEAAFHTIRFRQLYEREELKLKLISRELPEEINAETVQTRWTQYLEDLPLRRVHLNYLLKSGFLKRAVNRFFPAILNKSFDPAYLNLLRNEHHHEYLVGTLEKILGVKN